jgi:hypothetical protein
MVSGSQNRALGVAYYEHCRSECLPAIWVYPTPGGRASFVYDAETTNRGGYNHVGDLTLHELDWVCSLLRGALTGRGRVSGGSWHLSAYPLIMEKALAVCPEIVAIARAARSRATGA